MKQKKNQKNLEKRLEKLKEDIDNLPPEQVDKVEKIIHMMGKKVLSIKEAAEMFDLSLDTIRRAIKSGSLKAFQLNKQGNWKIPFEEIERFMKGGK